MSDERVFSLSGMATKCTFRPNFRLDTQAIHSNKKKRDTEMTHDVTTKLEAEHNIVVNNPDYRRRAQVVLDIAKATAVDTAQTETASINLTASLAADRAAHHYAAIDHVANATGTERGGGVLGYLNDAEFEYILSTFEERKSG